MARSVELSTTIDAFDNLHVLADNNRKAVKVERQALMNLLLDHTAMLQVLGVMGCKISTPPPPRRRERIIE